MFFFFFFFAFVCKFFHTSQIIPQSVTCATCPEKNTSKTNKQELNKTIKHKHKTTNKLPSQYAKPPLNKRFNPSDQMEPVGTKSLQGPNGSGNDVATIKKDRSNINAECTMKNLLIIMKRNGCIKTRISVITV